MVSWAKHNKFVQDEEAEAHHVKKRSPFLPNVPNPLDGIFRPISGLFQRGGGDWRPNIPYVILVADNLALTEQEPFNKSPDPYETLCFTKMALEEYGPDPPDLPIHED